MSAYPGYYTRESFGYTDKNGWTVKGWERWMEYKEALYAWQRHIAARRFHALPEDKGIPVPYTGKRLKRKWENGSGVSASSRVLSHYYADEGDKGRWVRKLVRNRERALWLAEWQEEQNEEAEYGYAVEEYDWTDYERLTDPYDYDYYYGENDNDPSDYDPGPYSVYDYVDFDPYDFEDYGSYCAHCGGECEL